MARNTLHFGQKKLESKEEKQFMVQITLNIKNKDDKRERKSYSKNQIYLRDQVTVLEEYPKIEKMADELQAHMLEAQNQLKKIIDGNDEVESTLENYQENADSLYPKRVELIQLHANLMSKLFDYQFSAEEFIDGCSAEDFENCQLIYMEVLGGESSEEKK